MYVGSYIQRNVSFVTLFQFVYTVQDVLNAEFYIPVFSQLCVLHKIELMERSFINVIKAGGSYREDF